MELLDLYEWCSDEWGHPLVIHPQGFGCESYTLQYGGEAIETFWAILNNRGNRQIVFLVGGSKSISEAAGPLVFDCPEYFFELVPEVNSEWRAKVKQFWNQQAKDTEK